MGILETVWECYRLYVGVSGELLVRLEMALEGSTSCVGWNAQAGEYLYVGVYLSWVLIGYQGILDEEFLVCFYIDCLFIQVSSYPYTISLNL